MEITKAGSGRRRRTRKQRQGLLARFRESQFSQSECAAQRGAGLFTLIKGLRLERDGVPAKVALQEVRLPDPVKHRPIEVVSPLGWIVRLHHGSNVGQLPELLRVLPC
jgi:hypothetical protein